MIASLQQNWKAYIMESICLGLFMVSASLFTTLLEFPESPIHQSISSDFFRLVLMGFAMGTTATLLIYSPMGRLSGAHMNPAVSAVFFALGKIKRNDFIFYVVFQCAGGVLAVYLMHALLGSAFEHPKVNFVITAPGKPGPGVALVMEVTIAFCMMLMVLVTSNHPKLNRYTAVLAGFFVMSYVILSGPVSGFGMNPARSLASAVPAMQFPSFWIYMIAPFAGMGLAASVYKFHNGRVRCAKYFHCKFYPCIFNCDYCTHQQEKKEAI
jgi:aquaporin Z